MKIDYLVGTMIELPRAALRAHIIAEAAEFFSFGTNDLTQTTFGIFAGDNARPSSRHINARASSSMSPSSRSISMVWEELIRIATERGRRTRNDMKLGICGEHGGDPASIHFCEEIGLDYVSCSPFRVPIARLAAAQAAIKQRMLR